MSIRDQKEKIRFRFVVQDTDRNGNIRHYFRRNGKKVRLLGRPGSAEFSRSYRAAYLGLEIEKASDLLIIPPLRPQQRREKSKLQLERRRQRLTSSGVYLLMLKGRIVYVGQSEDMATRVVSHRTNGRQFDRAYYIGAQGAQERKALETLLIAALNPEQNRAGKRQIVNGSMSQSKPAQQVAGLTDVFLQ